MVISYSWFTTKGLRVVGLPRWAQGGDIPIAIRHQAMHEVSGLRAVRQGHVLHQAGPWIHRREQTGHGWRCAEHPNRKDNFEKYRLRCPQAHTWTIERTRQQKSKFYRLPRPKATFGWCNIRNLDNIHYSCLFSPNFNRSIDNNINHWRKV